MHELSRRGLWAAGVGCACQLVGFSWDAVLHKLDPDLAARESVFSVANPSHALVALGLGLTALGVAWALYFWGLERAWPLPLSAGQALGALVLVSLLVGTGAIALSTGGLTQSHSHDATLAEAGHDHTRDQGSASAAAVTGPVMDELRTVLDAQGLEKALDRLEALAAGDQDVLGSGHNYAHELGRAAFWQYGSARDAFSRCRELFQSGCYHGVLEAHFDANPTIDPVTVAGLCDATVGANSALALRFQCVHGLGHGLTAHADHDLFKALTYCDYLRTDWDRQSCYGGAFMENIIFAQAQARGGDGHQHSHGGGAHQIHVRSDDLLYPCNAVADTYRRECYQMQTSIILWLNGTDYAAAFQTCETVPASYIATCYQSLGRDISGNTLRNTEQSLRLCGLGSMPYKPHCYVGAVKNFIDVTWQTDQAGDFCRRAPDEAKPACYGAIGEQVGLLFTDQTKKAAECAKMEPDYVYACDIAASVRRQS
jgi:hypothetical protein